MKDKPKYIFVLPNINIKKVNSKYEIVNTSNDFEVDNPEITTKLENLNIEKNDYQNVISFLDESKKTHNCNISMIDFKAKMNINLLRYHCYWCRNPFETRPIGLPINYISNRAIKKYYSYISKDVYTIKENITENRKDMIIDNDNNNINIDITDYYETDGVFCSFNCCKAYIIDNKHNNLYDKSEMFLTKMYNDMTSSQTKIIQSAPHWRLLEHYGGNLNIIEFRNSFNNIDYEYHGTTKNTPNFLSIGNIYEEKIKF